MSLLTELENRMSDGNEDLISTVSMEIQNLLSDLESDDNREGAIIIDHLDKVYDDDDESMGALEEIVIALKQVVPGIVSQVLK